jgi:hypothetical protein
MYTTKDAFIDVADIIERAVEANDAETLRRYAQVCFDKGDEEEAYHLQRAAEIADANNQ